MDESIKIIDYYNSQCKNSNWFANYYQCGSVGDGAVFKFLSTNYRTISTFEYYFDSFKKYINVPRSNWDKKETTGQEVAKQYVSNLVESFLYSSSRNKDGELIYNLTSRGQEFSAMIDNDFSEEDKRLLIFLFIVNSSFQQTPRYILKTAESVWNLWKEAGLKTNEIKNKIIEFFKSQLSERKIETIFNYDIVWYLSFYTDSSFLKLFSLASIEEKEKLKQSTIEAYKDKYKVKQNVLAWKYKSTNFQKPTLFDTLIMLYVSNSILEMMGTSVDFETFFSRIIEDFSSVISINKEKIFEFIKNNYSVFGIISANATSIEDDFTEKYIPVYRPVKEIKEEDIPTEKIDTTSQEGVEKLEVVRQVLKKLAKEKSSYKCALQDINGCHYFTSKEDNNNYLEIHHLIPREFSYDFEDTIEFVENYVPLCPHCHRMIHKAVDRERKGIITYLFNQRIAELKKHGIDVDIKTLYKFYKIDKD
jgi:ribosomal protein S16